MKLPARAAFGLALCAALVSPALAEKWTVTCLTAVLTAREKDATDAYEVLVLARFVMNVDTNAKSCALRVNGALYRKDDAATIVVTAKAAKCDLSATNKGRVVLNARVEFTADKVPSSPIVTLNYEVRSPPPAEGSPESKGEYMVISGFPVRKATGGKIDSRKQTPCAQAQPAS